MPSARPAEPGASAAAGRRPQRSDRTRRHPIGWQTSPIDRTEFNRWLELYGELWRTAGTDRLGELFADDATYSIGPYEPTASGLAAIADLWEREREGPDEVFTIDREIVAVEGRVGVARLEVDYGDPVDETFRDVWIIEVGDDGRCTRFEEWPHWPEGQRG